MVETEQQEEFNRIVKKSSLRFEFFANLTKTGILEECRLCAKTAFGDGKINTEWS